MAKCTVPSGLSHCLCCKKASAQTWQLHIFVESRSVEMDVKSLLSCWRAGRFIRILQSRRRPVIQYNVACKCLQLSSVVFGCTRPLYTGSMPMQMPQHAYVEWKGCLRSSFPRLGAYAVASTEFFVGQSCTWQIMVNLAPRLCLRNKNLHAYAHLCGVQNIRSRAYAAP